MSENSWSKFFATERWEEFIKIVKKHKWRLFVIYRNFFTSVWIVDSGSAIVRCYDDRPIYRVYQAEGDSQWTSNVHSVGGQTSRKVQIS
jgi:hypothetical protein